MKKKILFVSAAFVMSMSAAAISFVDGKVEKTEAYTKTSVTSITNIDLNDTSAEDIRSYYSSVTNLRGNDLLIALKQRLMDGQKYFAYDGWDIYQIADRD